MTGAKAGNNPWRSLAAEVINRARADCKGSVGTGIGDNLTRALLQYDAECWLESDPWCQYLLDCSLPPEYDVPQSYLAALERKRRRISYRKYLPEGIDPTEQFSIHSLSKITGLSKTKLNRAAQNGQLDTTQKPSGANIVWYTSITEIAKAVATGNLILCRK